MNIQFPTFNTVGIAPMYLFFVVLYVAVTITVVVINVAVKIATSVMKRNSQISTEVILDRIEHAKPAEESGA